MSTNYQCASCEPLIATRRLLDKALSVLDIIINRDAPVVEEGCGPRDVRKQASLQLLREALRESNGNQQRAAARLGISPRVIGYLVRERYAAEVADLVPTKKNMSKRKPRWPGSDTGL